MHALQLDFAPAAVARQGLAGRLIGIALLAFAAAAAALAVQQHEQRQTGIDELQSRLDRMQRRVQSPADAVDDAGSRRAGTSARGADDDAELQRRLQQANAVIDQLAVPWTRLFGAIEAVPTQGVVLQELLPDARAGSLRLRATAPELDSALAYTARLSRQPALGQVHLVSYARTEAAAVSTDRAPLVFMVQATWQPR